MYQIFGELTFFTFRAYIYPSTRRHVTEDRNLEIYFGNFVDKVCTHNFRSVCTARVRNKTICSTNTMQHSVLAKKD